MQRTGNRTQRSGGSELNTPRGDSNRSLWQVQGCRVPAQPPYGAGAELPAAFLQLAEHSLQPDIQLVRPLAFQISIHSLESAD